MVLFLDESLWALTTSNFAVLKTTYWFKGLKVESDWLAVKMSKQEVVCVLSAEAVEVTYEGFKAANFYFKIYKIIRKLHRSLHFPPRSPRASLSYYL